MYHRRFQHKRRARLKIVDRFAREYPYNEYIKVPQVRVIDEEGRNLGILDTAEALRIAKEKGIDLVMIARHARPPVCKLVELAHFKYQLQKKEKEKRKGQRKTKIKEVKFSPKIAEGDLQRKVEKVKELAQDGYTVKITVVRRRWMHKDMVEQFRTKLLTLLEECCTILNSNSKGKDIHILVKAKNAKAENIKNLKKKN